MSLFIYSWAENYRMGDMLKSLFANLKTNLVFRLIYRNYRCTF